MTITIELPSDVAGRLNRKAAQDGQDMAEYVQSLVVHAAGVPDVAEMEAQINAVSRQRAPQSLEDVTPRRQPPPGKTAMQMIQGQWPGDEKTEQLLAQHKALG